MPSCPPIFFISLLSFLFLLPSLLQLLQDFLLGPTSQWLFYLGRLVVCILFTSLVLNFPFSSTLPALPCLLGGHFIKLDCNLLGGRAFLSLFCNVFGLLWELFKQIWKEWRWSHRLVCLAVPFPHWIIGIGFFLTMKVCNKTTFCKCHFGFVFA